MRLMPGTAVVTAVLVFALGCSRPAGQTAAVREAAPRIQLNLDSLGSGTVDVLGLPADDLAQLERSTLTRDDWTALLRVAIKASSGESPDRPPVLGSYSVTAGALRFTPRFPLAPGQRYDVVFDPAQLPSATGRRPSPAPFPQVK